MLLQDAGEPAQCAHALSMKLPPPGIARCGVSSVVLRTSGVSSAVDAPAAADPFWPGHAIFRTGRRIAMGLWSCSKISAHRLPGLLRRGLNWGHRPTGHRRRVCFPGKSRSLAVRPGTGAREDTNHSPETISMILASYLLAQTLGAQPNFRASCTLSQVSL
jgi:hypothetical protein